MALNWQNDPNRPSHPLPAFKKLAGLAFWLTVWVVVIVVGWALMTAGAGE